jgi:hypothetical protein
MFFLDRKGVVFVAPFFSILLGHKSPDERSR